MADQAREALRRSAIDDLYAVFAPDVVLEAEVEAVIARIVAIESATPAPDTGAEERLRAALDVDVLARSIPTADLQMWFFRIYDVHHQGRAALAETRAFAEFIAKNYAELLALSGGSVDEGTLDRPDRA